MMTAATDAAIAYDTLTRDAVTRAPMQGEHPITARSTRRRTRGRAPRDDARMPPRARGMNRTSDILAGLRLKEPLWAAIVVHIRADLTGPVTGSRESFHGDDFCLRNSSLAGWCAGAIARYHVRVSER